MISRRAFLRTILSGAATTVAGAAYATGYAPLQTPRVVHYRLTHETWRNGPGITVAALGDLHACEPWMSITRIERIVEQTNRLQPDLIVLLGDYVAGMRRLCRPLPAREWAAALSGLSAPLGVHAILGNHDMWDDRVVQTAGGGPTIARRALEKRGVPVYENAAIRLERNGSGFWLAGLADQYALAVGGRDRWRGLDDLEGTLDQVNTDDPILLLAHEPDIFPSVPARVALTLSGHTHGGQVRMLGWSPIVPSRFGNRYAYGHVLEDGKNLVVSGGLGCSIFPLRFGVPPEITLVSLGSAI
jgi:predicted MPP superfamily phosphohydrolase